MLEICSPILKNWKAHDGRSIVVYSTSWIYYKSKVSIITCNSTNDTKWENSLGYIVYDVVLSVVTGAIDNPNPFIHCAPVHLNIVWYYELGDNSDQDTQ